MYLPARIECTSISLIRNPNLTACAHCVSCAHDFSLNFWAFFPTNLLSVHSIWRKELVRKSSLLLWCICTYYIVVWDCCIISDWIAINFACRGETSPSANDKSHEKRPQMNHGDCDLRHEKNDDEIIIIDSFGWIYVQELAGPSVNHAVYWGECNR